MKAAAVTRKFYSWEDAHIPTGRWLTKRRTAALTSAVWKYAASLPRYRRRARRLAPPTVKFGRGVLQSGRYLSYCVGYSQIVLAPSSRNEATLIHELTHALGPVGHGPRFQELYLQLILKFVVRG
jgi:hypothetical protein